MRYSATFFDNGRTHKGIIFVAILLAVMNAYAWEQKEFMIGTYSPPIVSPDIILLPGDYDGDGRSDMSIIIRAGSHAGDWMIDYGYNGFTTNGWEERYTGYTDTDAQYFAADFDVDDEDDVEVKGKPAKLLYCYGNTSPYKLFKATVNSSIFLL